MSSRTGSALRFGPSGSPRRTLGLLVVGVLLGSGAPAALANPPDPATHTVNGWCYNVARHNGTRGRIYYPPNGGCSASRFSPLVLFMPGNGYDISEYHDLFRRLARNGYIVVAPDVGNTLFPVEIPGTADRAWAYLTDYVLRRWSKRAFIDTQRTVLMGHSRGGEAIRFLPAAHIAQDNRFDVDAMVALAPSNFYDVPVTGLQTPAALYIIGTRDEDLGADPTYESADRSGHSGSQTDPIPQPGALYRSVKLVERGTHAGFALVGPQMDLTRGYVLAFLNAHVRQDLTFYETYIRGDAVPGSWPHPVTTQYRDGFLRRVIDDFDDGELPTSTMNTSVVATAGAATQVDLSSDSSTPHVAQALRFEPPFSNAIVRWTLPSGRRDARAFKHLSVRIGQVDGPVTDDLWVQVRAFGQPMVERRLSDFGPIARPLRFCNGPNCVAQYLDQAHMGTIRIPVSEFGEVSDVRSVTLLARREAADGTFIVDDVEFSEWIFAP